MHRMKKMYKSQKQERAERNALLKNIFLARHELECATQNFSYATDPTLIDMYTYQIKACQAKYHYLMCRAKEAGLTQDGMLLAYTVTG